MNLFLRGRDANAGSRAPLWQMRLAGAALGYCTLLLADQLGFSEVTGFRSVVMRPGSMLVGALLATTSWGAMLWVVNGALVALSLLVAFTPIVQTQLPNFVRRDSTSATVDAVVVLSASMNDEGRMNGPIMERLLTGLAESRRRSVPVMALSVIETGSGARHVTSEADERALMALLAPDIAVSLVHGVHSTRDEALKFVALANTNHWKRVALVTSPLHTRRACRTIERAGLAVTCVPADGREYSVARLYAPRARMHAFQDLLYESAATMLYSVRGWI